MNYLSALLISFIFSLPAYCSDPTVVNFCTNTTNSIVLADLLNCNEVMVNDQSWSVQTLKLGFEANGTYYDQIITNNIIPQAFLNQIQTLSPDKIYMKDIKLINANNEEKSLKNKTIKIIN